MNNTKAAVDKRVSLLLSRIKDENERNLKGYQIAKLYIDVKEYEFARRYLSGFLTLKDNFSPAHKLMGEIYEGLRQHGKALASYKRSLELDGKQKDILLRICRIYTQIKVEPQVAMYWVERAEKVWPGHDEVFQLKEHLLSSSGGSDVENLEDLLAAELVKRPKDVNLRIKLLSLYTKSGRVNEAYEHAIKVENTGAHRASIKWYKFLTEVFEEYENQSGKKANGAFHRQFLSVLNNYLMLALEFCSTTDAAEILYKFDQCLYSCMQIGSKLDQSDTLLSQMQAHFFWHAGTIILKHAQKNNLNWKEAIGWAAASYIVSYATEPSSGKQQQDTDEQNRLSSYRASQTGHMLRVMCANDLNQKQWMEKMQEQYSLKQKRDLFYERIFTRTSFPDKKSTSYLMQSFQDNVPVRFPNLEQLQSYDSVAQTMKTADLHEVVWLALQHYQVNQDTQPHYEFCLFEHLPYSCKRLGTSAPESFCQLDAQAFLYAVVRCSALQIEERRNSGYRDADEPRFLPACLNSRLCHKDQGDWWTSANALYNNTAKDNFAKKRLELQKGLETVRCLGNHGMSVGLVIHLAKTFGERVTELRSNCQDEVAFANKSSALQERALHYWKIALEMLERLNRNQTLRIPVKRLFMSPEADPCGEDLTRYLNEGRSYLAQHAALSGEVETAIQLFSKVSTADAALQQAQLYESLAEEVCESQLETDKNGCDRSEQFTGLLSKCRDQLNVSMDRISANRNHRLYGILSSKIDDVEAKLSGNQKGHSVAEDVDASVQDEADVLDALDMQKKSSFMAHSTPHARRAHSASRSPAWYDYNVNHQKSYDHITQKEPTASQASVDKIEAKLESLRISMDAKYEEVIKQNVEILSDLKLTRAEVSQMKQKMDQLEQFMKEGPSIALAHLNQGGAPSPVSAVQQAAYLRTHSPYHPQDMDYSRPPSYMFTQPPLHPGYNVSVSQPDMRSPAQGKISASQKSASDHYANDDEDYDEYDDEQPYEDEPVANIPPVVGISHHQAAPPTGHHPQFHIPDSQLVQDWPYGNTVNLEGKSTLTYAPNTSPLHTPRYLSGGVLRGPQPGLYQAPPVAPPGAHAAMPGPGYFARPGGIPVSYPAPDQGGLKLPVPASHTATSRPFLIQQPSSLSSSVFNMMPPNAVLSTTPGVTPGISLTNQKTVSATSVTGESLFKSNLGTPVSMVSSAAPVMPSLTQGLPPSAPPAGQTPVSVPLFASPGKSIIGKPSSTQPVKACGSIMTGTVATSPASVTTTVKSPAKTATANTGAADTSTHEGTDGEDQNDSYQGPDFEPIVPLPDEVEVKTGEEGEKVLFKERGKLYRFVDDQWKERGTGEIKILKKEATNQFRIVMRRDQIHKVCANHYILPDMDVTAKADGKGKVMSWTCLDFSEEEQSAEKFCCRFKTAEIAQNFSDQFKEAVKLAKDATSPVKTTAAVTSTFPPAKPSLGFGDKFKPAADSWDCSVCMVNNKADVNQCPACQTPKPGTEAVTSTKAAFTSSFPSSSGGSSGFTFGVKPGTAFSFGAPSTAKDKPAASATLGSSTGFTFGQPSKAEATSSTSSVTTKSVFPTSGFSFDTPKPVAVPKSETSHISSTTVSSSTGQTKSTIASDAATKTPSDKPTFGGFTFKSAPVIQTEDKTPKPDSTVDKSKGKNKEDQETPKENPFASFSFTPSSSTSGFSFGSTSSTPSFTSLANSATPKSGFGGTSPGKAFELTGQPLFSDKKSPQQNASKKDAAAEDEDAVEEFEPNVDFKPVVPLPSIVDVKTGEEEEEALFDERGKLFRHCDDSKAWKERGIGNIKILKHSGGKRYRIVMRREQVLKLCANHAITKEMKLLHMHQSDRAWCWFAQDYSEEEMKREHFAIRFKNLKIATDFKEVFESCQKDLRENKPTTPKTPDSAPKLDKTKADSTKTQSLAAMFKPKAGSWECEGCFVRNDASVTKCPSCSTLKPGAEPEQSDQVSSTSSSSAASTSFGGGVQFGSDIKLPTQTGFKFGSGGGFQFGTPSKDTSKLAAGDGTKGGFSFTFGSSTPSSKGEGSGKPSGFDFTLSTSTESPSSKVAGTPSKADNSVQEPSSPGDGYYINQDSEDAHIHFEPVIPLPDKITVKTGEEDEECIFKSRGKLFRFTNSEWKERGIGEIKILRSLLGNKLSRLLMRREQVLKVCCNHMITSDLELQPMQNAKGRAFIWHAQDFSEPEGQHEKFAIRFGNESIANEFKKHFDEAKNSAVLAESKGKPEELNSSIDSFTFKIPEKELSKTPPAPAKFQFKSPVSGKNTAEDDVVFLFEEEPTEDQVARAQKWLLPRNFYLYEQRKPCSGCRGCTDDMGAPNAASLKTKIDSQVGQSELARLLKEETGDGATVSSPAPLFGAARNIFGAAAPGGSSFLARAEETSADTSAPKADTNFFASSSSALSFASLAGDNKNTGFTKKETNPNFTWSGAGQTVFGKSAHSSKDGDGEEGGDDEAGEVEQCADIHFEPIVELPKLVDVKTGEEDETVVFSQRGKVYRFDSNQWKERGIGEMKILKNAAGRFRLLLRREQVLKVALNHLLTADMELKPMATSETAWCWYAVDYSDNEPNQSQFAVKFKTIPVAHDFKQAFQNCQNMLTESRFGEDSGQVQSLGATPDVVQATQSVNKADTGDSGDQAVPSVVGEAAARNVTQNEDRDDEEEEDDEDYEDEYTIMFQKRATLNVLNPDSTWTNVGMGELQVISDEDVSGARIYMISDHNVNMCNHIICMETKMKLNDKSRCCEWTAMDFATDEGERKTFRTNFSSAAAAVDFYQAFQEGLAMARESEISERNDRASFPNEIMCPEVVGIAQSNDTPAAAVGTCSPDLTAELESITQPHNKGNGGS